MDSDDPATRPPWDLYERTWAWYAITVSAATVLFAVGRRGSAAFSPWTYVAIHAGLLAVILGLPLLVRRDAPRRAGAWHVR